MRYDGIGDTAALAPLIVALRSAGHELGLIAMPATVDLFRGDMIRSHVVENIAEPHAVLPDVRAREYEIALIATEKPYAYTLAKEAAIPKRIGFWNGLTKPLKSVWVRSLCTSVRLRGGGHEVESLFRLGRGLHEEEPTRDIDRLSELFLPMQAERRGGISLQVTPKWLDYGDVDDIAQLFRMLADSMEVRMIGSTREEKFVQSIEAHTQLPVERHPTVRTWVQHIAGAQTLLTPDTGAAHVAGMVGTHVIDCFPARASQKFQTRWKPWASESICFTMANLQNGRAFKLLRSAVATLAEHRGPS